MDCKTFRELLPCYLGGDVPADLFDALVEHEATCSTCQELAAATMGGPAGAGRSATVEPAGDWMARTLDRTVGADCGYIRLRLAEAVDAPLVADSARRVETHLEACADCRALATVLRELPAYYDALPRLRADDAFAREILARTVPARPSVLAVLRALVRRPEALWEGAAVCALLAAPLAGPSMTGWIHSARQAGDRIEQQVSVASIAGSLSSPLSVAGARVVATIGDGRQSIVDGLSRTRARVGEFMYTEIENRVASNPRIAVLAPALEDALDRIGLFDADRPAGAGETVRPAEAEETVAPEPPSDGGNTP